MGKFDMMALMNTASQSEAAKPRYEMKTLPIEAIIPNPANHYSMDGIDELADAILLAGRVLQNIVVKAADKDGHYMIISGHRTHLACKQLVAQGRDEFADIAALVENEADEDMRELMLIYTNSTARMLTDAEKMRQAQRATDILKQMKAAGKFSARVSAAYESSGLSTEGQRQIADKLQEEGTVSIQDVSEVKVQEKAGNAAETKAKKRPEIKEEQDAGGAASEPIAEPSQKSPPVIQQEAEAYAMQAVYEDLKNLKARYQGAAARAAAISDTEQAEANLQAAAAYIETFMEIVAQDMADIGREEG